MRNLFLVLGLLMGSISQAQHHHGRHGMVLFGREKIFLSHLPLYSNPHDAQIIFEVLLASDTQIALNQSRTTHLTELLYTFNPLPFDLFEQARTLAAFGGTLYRGHFETRERVEVLAGNLITPRKAHFFKQLNRRENPRRQNYEGFLLGTATDLYVVHHITSAPNFDQILKVATVLPENFSIENGLRIIVQGRADSPLVPGENLTAQIFSRDMEALGTWAFQVGEQIHKDFDELL